MGGEGYEVRLARREDEAAIRGEMSAGMYEGLDYCCADLDEWWVEPDRRMWVAVDRQTGEAVGFCSTRLVDAGRTAIEQSLRVHPSARGKGVAKLLQAAQFRYMARHPTARTLRPTARGDSESSIRLHLSQGFRLTARLGTALMHPKDYVKFSAPVPQVEYAAPPRREEWAFGEGMLRSAEEVYAVAAEGGFLAQTDGVLFYEWCGYALRTGSPEARAAALQNIEWLLAHGVVFLHDPARGALVYFKVRVFQRGRILQLNILTNGRAEPIRPLAVPLIRRALGVGCVAVGLFYDGALHATGTPPHPEIAATAEEAGLALDSGGFDLTGAGLVAMEKYFDAPAEEEEEEEGAEA